MRKHFLILVLLTVSACGPIYSTEYVFEPPQLAAGSDCIGTCKEYRDVCKQHMNISKEDCEAENQELMDDCNDKIFRDKNRAPKWTECGRQLACDFPESRCESDYRDCYKRCGGTVKEEQVCIMNCENAKSNK